MTKFRKHTVIPQLIHPNIDGEVMFPFGPPIYRTEIDHGILDKLIEEGKKQRDNKDLDFRDKLAGNMKTGTSILFPNEQGKNQLRQDADKVIVTKVFEFFEVLQSAHGPDWKNIYTMMNNKALRLDHLWINFQEKGDYNPSHDHTGAFSFVIFGDIDEKIFTENTPKTNSQYAGQLVFHYGEKISGLQQTQLNVKPYKGLMYVFPATLQHFVPPFFTDFTRISISGNYILEPNVRQ